MRGKGKRYAAAGPASLGRLPTSLQALSEENEQLAERLNGVGGQVEAARKEAEDARRELQAAAMAVAAMGAERDAFKSGAHEASERATVGFVVPVQSGLAAAAAQCRRCGVAASAFTLARPPPLHSPSPSLAPASQPHNPPLRPSPRAQRRAWPLKTWPWRTSCWT